MCRTRSATTSTGGTIPVLPLNHHAAVATGTLRRVQRGVGGCDRSVGWNRAAHADRDRNLESGGDLPPRGGAHCVVQPRCDLLGRLIPAEDEDEELVPAVAHRYVVGPAVGAQDDGDPAQHLVPDGVRVVVVDLLELVDVDEHDG